MSIYELYEIDPKAESEGVWVTTISDPEQFLLASAGNSKAVEYSRKQLEPKAAQLRRAQKLAERPGGKIPEEINKFIQEVDLKTFCHCVLLDWKNVKDRNGEEIPFSAENAMKLLSDPTLRKLKEALFEEAARQANFVKQHKEDAEKNSETASAGI